MFLLHVHRFLNLQLIRGTYSNEASGFHFIIGCLYWRGGDGVLPRQLRCHGDSKTISSSLKKNKIKICWWDIRAFNNDYAQSIEFLMKTFL
jgi:hypothetical protein